MIRAQSLELDIAAAGMAGRSGQGAILGHLVELLKIYETLQDPAPRLACLGRIFFTLDAYMKEVGRAPVPVASARGTRARGNAMIGDPSPDQSLQLKSWALEGSVRALYQEVALLLASCFQTSINVLPRRLEERFGTGISRHGMGIDTRWLSTEMTGLATGNGDGKELQYLGEAQRQRHRVIFQNGLARHLDLSRSPAHEGFVHTVGSTGRRHQDKHRDDAWGFVLGITRALYVADHATTQGADGHFFHSSYYAGGNVLTAGDVVFEHGQLRSVTNASGHYQPPARTLLHFFDLMKASGVDLREVLVGIVGPDTPDGILGAWSNKERFAKDAVKAEDFIAEAEAAGWRELLDAGPDWETLPTEAKEFYLTRKDRQDLNFKGRLRR